MRTTAALVLGLLLAPSALHAQTTATAAVPENPDLSNLIDFGARGTAYGAGSDEARYQRYRDMRDSATLDVLFWNHETEKQLLTARADHVGYRDQRYELSFNHFGKVKASFDADQIPLFFSKTTSEFYTSPSQGTLLIPDAIQAGLQNKTLTTTQAAAFASPFDLRLKRNIQTFNLTYSATPHLDVNVRFRNTTKDGRQPWAGSFGFSDAVELGVPVDTRTTDLGVAAEWLASRGSVRLGYDGSFFRNNVATLVWDNPLRVTDSPTLGPVQGREALWPNSDLNAGSLGGVLKLGSRTQATAFVSLGDWSQNDPLIPYTINSSLPTIPLDRPTANADARVTATALSFNARPTNQVWLNARFRSYDFDNRTPIFRVVNTVAYDTSVAAFAEGGTSPYAFTRQTFDADAAYTPVSYAALRVAYTREAVDQTFRSFDSTTEDTVRLSADATGVHWLTVRAVYEHAKRVGSGFDEQALDDIGEQVSLRQFDISDRRSNRFSGIAIVTPIAPLSFNATVSAGNEDRPGAAFGLQSNDNRAYGVGLDYVPRDAVSVGLAYEHETFSTLQRSRQANPGPQFNDPTRDWTTDGDDLADTFTASLDLLKVLRKTDVRIAYDYSHAKSTYVYGLAPNTTLPPVTQLPPVVNEFQRATLDARYHITPRVAAGLVYWYDQYRVDDYALGQETLTSIAQPSFFMLGYVFRPYTANTVMGRLTVFW